jgi:hypothetical protein
VSRSLESSSVYSRRVITARSIAFAALYWGLGKEFFSLHPAAEAGISWRQNVPALVYEPLAICTTSWAKVGATVMLMKWMVDR